MLVIMVTATNEQPIYVNQFCIEVIVGTPDASTLIQFYSGKTRLVKEPPEAILRMIRESYTI